MNKRPTNTKGIIFDMDGVLIDSEPFYFEVQTGFVKEQGTEISREDYDKWCGTASTDMWTAWKKEYKLKQSVAELMQMNEERYISYLKARALSPINGVTELFDLLDNKGIKKAVASSSLPAIIDTTLNGIGLSNRVDYVISGEEVENGKPAPDVFLQAAKGLGLSPTECIVIEDAHHGVTATKAAGMFCIAYQNPNSGNQDLRKADLIMDSFKEITEFINNK